jgi:hypothetical protein
VSWTRLRCTGGFLNVLIRSDTELFKGVAYQTLAVTGTTPAKTLRFPPSAHPSLHLPLVPVDGVCRVELAVSPVRRPADYPRLKNADPRLLGLHFDSIRYVPPK